MNLWKWKVPEDKEGELKTKLPSDLELQGYTLASFCYFVFIQLLVLKFTPFVILPSLTAMFPLMTVIAQSPVFFRMQEKTKSKLETLENSKVFGQLSGKDKEMDFDGDDEGVYGLDSAEDAELNDTGDDNVTTSNAANSPNKVFDKSAGASRVRAIVSRRKREQQDAGGDGGDEHGKENQWGDVVLEDEQNSQ
jgi:hypothetical protein